MKRIVSIVLSFILLFSGSQMRSQEMKQYFFSHFTTRDGLASNNVNSIVQDKKGYLWIGTINGLQRFDGHSFISFRHDPKNGYSIPSNEVLQVHIDRKQNLWILFNNGRVGIFNTNTFRFREVNVIMNERAKQNDKNLQEDSQGNIIIIFHSIAIVTYNEKANSFSADYNFLVTPPGWTIWRVTEDTVTGNYWLASSSGLAVYNRKTNKVSYRDHNISREPAIDQYRDAIDVGIPYIDRKRRLWFQTWTHAGAPSFYCYDLLQNKPLIHKLDMGIPLGGYCEPKQFLEQQDGRMILTGFPALAEYSEEKKTFIPIHNALASELGSEYNHIFQSYIDKEQNIWLCTRNDGLYRFNPSAQLFTSVPHLNPNTGLPGMNGVLSILETFDRSFLVSTWGEGILRYDTNLQQIPINMKGIQEKNGNTIWSMVQRKDSSIWFGLQEDGGNIMIYDARKKVITRYRLFERNTIRQMVEDKEGNIWLGTQSGGVFKWDAEKGSKKIEDGFSRIEGIPATLIFMLYIDLDGFLWVTTIADGVYKVNVRSGEIVEHISSTTEPRLIQSRTGPILQYNDTIMLIAAGGLNIYNTRTKKVTYLTSTDGLPSSHIMSMLKDDSGFVWLGMKNGLCRLNLSNRSINYYDRYDGMVNDNFGISAAKRLKDGRFLFGTNKDFVVFNPTGIVKSDIPPDVTITDFKLSDKSLRLDSLLALEAIELTYDNNSIVIDFASLTNLPQNKFTYHYMLEGVDKDWIKSEKVTRAIYPFIAPGKYNFKIRAENPEGKFSARTTELTIDVSPPFWQTWWFYSLLALATATILYLLDRERMKRKEAIQKMRSNIAGNLHEDINTALSNINILSEMAKLKADKEPEKSKEFIEQIHTRSNNMILAMDDMLWSIDPDNDSMPKTVLRMKEYIDELNNSYDTDIKMLIDDKVNALKLGMEFRHEAFILFKESILGLMKACVKSCMIHVGVDKSHLVYTIEFRNHLCDMQQFRNLLERQDIQKRLDMLHATSNIQVHKEFTVVEMSMPTINK
ncbi:MAG TPA: two-component regulator propeller domain-containing protein [Chitinophagaceae bacterium]